MQLTWSTYDVHGTCVLALAGGLCEETVLLVEPEVARLFAGDRSALVVDLAGVTACDAAGVAMLDATGRASSAAGVELRLASPRIPVLHALHARGLASRLQIFGSLDGAVRADPLDLL
jgi:anti-anti-sigma factor